MPSLSLTKTAANGLAHDASHVNTPLTEVETWANTTKLDYLNVQDNGLRTSSLRTHAQVDAVRIKVRNATGSTIAANSLIYFNGTYSDGTNNYPTIAKAVTATSVGSTFFAQAVTTGAIANGADGTAAIFYELTGQNTSSGTVGDSVYLDTTAGGWTRTRPTGGQYVQVVGTITVVNASSGRVGLSLGAVPEHLTGGASGLGATFQTLTVQGASGGAADIYHISDAGEDNADKWKISVADGGNMTWENYTSGSYAAKLTLTSAGAVTTAGALNIGSVSAAGTDTDKFLVLDSSSNVDYRTGAQVLSDIGAQASGTYTTLAFKTIAVSGQDNVVADAADDTLTLAAGSNITITTTAGSDTVTIAGSAGGIASVVADTTPQLGGDLDVNGQSIVSDSGNENIPITPHGTGSVVISKLSVTGDTSLDGGSFVFNESGADKDFRIEGDSQANLFVADASTDRIGIGVAAPDTLMHLETASAATAVLQIESTATNGYPTLKFKNDAQTWNVYGANGGSGTYPDCFQIQNGSAELKIATDGDVIIGDGDLVIGTSGHGIDFSAHAHAGGMTSELLDDYETGSFTPVVKYGTSSYSLDWSDARYVKVGNLVHFHLAAQVVTSASNDTSILYIHGLPFTSHDSVSSHIRYIAAWEYNSSGHLPTWYLNQNNTILTMLIHKTDGNVWANAASSQVYRSSGSNEVFVAGTYVAA